MSPFFSIVIPTFNSAKVIHRAVDSVLSQTCKDFEIIVIDGASTDNTVDLILSKDDSRIRMSSEADHGIYDAMNKGIRQANGRWLYFLGSDDCLFNEYVLRDLHKFVNANADLEMIYGNVSIIGSSSLAPEGTLYDGVFTVSKLLAKNISHQAILYETAIFDRLGFYNIAYSSCADWDFNHRCFAMARVGFCNITIAFFQGGGQSEMKSMDQFTRDDFAFNLARYYKKSYFDSMFKSQSHYFLNFAKKKRKEKQLLLSLKFLAVGVYHSNRKIGMIRHYLKSIA